MPSKAEREKQEMSEYGEPWRLVESPTGGWQMWSSSDERGVDWEWRNGQRIVDCVNAMQGIPNPEAVRELIEAAKDVCRPTESEGHYAEAEEAVERIYRLEAAIEALSASPQQK